MRDRLYSDMIKARKEKNKELVSILTLAWAEITGTEKAEKTAKLDNSRFIAIMNKLIKQDKETLEGFQKRGDQENIEALEKRIMVYQSYLPQQLSDAELERIVREVIASIPADQANMGTIMKAVTPRVAGGAEMSRVSGWVKTILSKG